jgi:hypothetical protein
MLRRAVLTCWAVSAVARWGQSQVQIDAKSQPAVTQLAAVAHAIKECPREVPVKEGHWGKKPDEIERWYVGPPENVVWDVVPSSSARAPYSGYVEFTVHWNIEILPHGSMDRYMRKHGDYWFLMQKNFVQNPVDYRYEFDVGEKGLELIKSMSRAQCETVGSITSPCQKPGWQSIPPAYCWGKTAQEGQTVSYQEKRPGP